MSEERIISGAPAPGEADSVPRCAVAAGAAGHTRLSNAPVNASAPTAIKSVRSLDFTFAKRADRQRERDRRIDSRVRRHLRETAPRPSPVGG